MALLETQVGIYRLAKVTGGGGRGEPASFELPALVYGDTITVDFSPKGGPFGLTGKYDVRGDKGILWPDKNKWPKVEKQ